MRRVELAGSSRERASSAAVRPLFPAALSVSRIARVRTAPGDPERSSAAARIASIRIVFAIDSAYGMNSIDGNTGRGGADAGIRGKSFGRGEGRGSPPFAHPQGDG